MASPISEAPGKGRTIPSIIENGAAPIPRYLSTVIHSTCGIQAQRERASHWAGEWLTGLNGDDILANHEP
jgi:hypothetical protein